MDSYSKNKISVECYNEIFYQLKNDIKTLYNCTFVNRFFCRLATPLLWGTPFEHINLENPKSPLIINTYVSSLVDEDKSFLRLTGIPLELPEATFFYYPEFLKSFNSQVFQILIERWLILMEPYNYYVNYQDKLVYSTYLVSNLLFASTNKLESLNYFRLSSHDRMFFINHKEFVYSISHLVNLEITYFAGANNPNIQEDENNLNNLFDTLSHYTFSIRYVKINISSNYIASFTSRFIESIFNFIAHQYKLEALSFNESLIFENLFEFEEIIKSQETNLRHLTIGGKLKNFSRIVKVLRNCSNLESLIFEGKKGSIIEEDNWGYYDVKMREIPIIEEIDFNKLKIRKIYCIEDCVSVDDVDDGYSNYMYDEQQQEEFETTGGDSSISDDMVTLGLKKILLMTSANLRTLNLDFWSFTKLLEVLSGLEHLELKLELKLELSSMLNDNYIVTFTNSLPNSLQKLGLNIYSDEDEFITYFLMKLLENMGYNKLFELYFCNEKMIRNENLRLILQFALNRIRYYGNDLYYKMGENVWTSYVKKFRTVISYFRILDVLDIRYIRCIAILLIICYAINWYLIFGICHGTGTTLASIK
ncbi:hypothetical protein GLOIN_2v1613602 [Rhizophagus irregularis DAOM 181602=DAOM 197198]|nr:hypothetical protein GLOIN_2v1613602 [Rhizophagus irregularis DAOM 181602=DAOM 197198]